MKGAIRVWRDRTMRGKGMIAQKQTQEVEQIRDAVMDRRGGHQQHATPDDEAGERPVTVRVGIAEAVVQLGRCSVGRQ